MARKKKSTCNKWDDDGVEWRSPVRKDNQDHHKETDKATKQRGGLSWVTIQKHLTDRLAPIKKAIRDSLEPLRAERLIRKMEVSPGGSAMGMVEAQKHLREIYGDMKEGEESNFNEVVLALRIIAIDKNRVAIARREIKQLTGDETGAFRVFDTGNQTELKLLRKLLKDKSYSPKTKGSYVTLKFVKDKDNPKKKNKIPVEFLDKDKAILDSSQEVDRILRDSEILHPGNKGAVEQQAFLDEMKEKDSKSYIRLHDKAIEYFNVYKKQLETMYLEGLITSDDYLHFKAVGHYSPRQYLKFFDPDIKFENLAAITTGSTGSINMDSANLLKEYITRLHLRIARNKANVELYHAAKAGEAPGLISIVDVDAEEKVGDNFKLINAYVNGKKYRMKMPLEFGKSWLESESTLAHSTARMLRTWSGADLVRAGATGYNPEFAITNLPRDLMFSWFRTREYSNWVPMAVPQMAKRMWETRKDVWHTGEDPIGDAKEYLEEYGMMDFLTQQGEFGGKAWKHDKSKSSWQKFKNVASFVGAKTELWVRLALRKQAIMNRAAKNNGVVTQEMRDEASWIARGYLDFSKGGSSVKVADTVIPYLNASLIATTGLAETLLGKGGTGYHKHGSKYIINEGNIVAWGKIFQFFGIMTSSVMANLIYWPEEYGKMDDNARDSNLIIPLPFMKEKDKADNSIMGMFKVPLDQGQTMIANMVGAMVSASLRSMGYGNGDTALDKYANRRVKVYRDGILQGVRNLSMPPTVKAFLGYFANIDTYGWKPVVPGEPKDNLGSEYLGRTPFDHPFLSMSVDKLNEKFPEFGGLIPAEPFSPARIAFVFNTFFVTSNSFVKLVGSMWNAGYGEFNGLEKELFGDDELNDIDGRIGTDIRETLKILPGVHRFFEYTPGEDRDDIENTRLIGISNNEKDAEINANMFGYLGKLNDVDPPEGKTRGLTPDANRLIKKATEYVRSLDITVDKRRRLMNRIIDAKSYKASVGKLKNPQFWYDVGREGDPKTRAEMIFHKWKRHPEFQSQLLREFRRLRRVSNEKTKLYLNAMIRNYRGERQIKFTSER